MLNLKPIPFFKKKKMEFEESNILPQPQVSRDKCDRCYQNICLPQEDWQLPFPSSWNLAAML